MEKSLPMTEREARVDLIAKQALRLFVKNGFDATSIRDIANANRISIGTLYYYIRTKVDILEYLVAEDARYTQEFIDGLPKSGSDTMASLKVAMERFIRRCDQVQDWLIVGNRETLRLPPKTRDDLLASDARMRAVFERLIAQGVRSGEMEREDPSDVSLNIMVVGYAWALRRWHLRKEYTLESYTRQQIGMIERLLQPRGEKRSEQSEVGRNRLKV